MESASVPAPEKGQAAAPAGLKKGAVSYLSNIVIGVASVAPGYSIAATLGFVVAVAGVGLQAPAVMLIAFLPMYCIAYAYRYMNQADPDCGTTFSWVTRGLGPRAGWLGGWAIVVTDIIVMASLAQIAAIYSFLLVGWDGGVDSQVAVMIAGVIWIAIMTAICYIGTEISATTQKYLLTTEVVILVAFAIVALIKVYTGAPAGSVNVSASWFNPFAVDSFSGLIDGVLLGTFIYWGWDSGVAVNEESDDPRGSGKSAVIATLFLLVLYLLVSAASQAFAGPQTLIDNADDILSKLGTDVFGSPWDKLLIITVLTSASASTQTTILPTARATLSMARQNAFRSSSAGFIRAFSRRAIRPCGWERSRRSGLLLSSCSAPTTCWVTRSPRSASGSPSTTGSPASRAPGSTATSCARTHGRSSTGACCLCSGG